MFSRAHLFAIAERFTGSTEVDGSVSNPQILAMLKLDAEWPGDDEVPWCSAFVNYVAWLARCPRSKDLRARSWLRVGIGITIDQAEPGDVVVLKRGVGVQPGPDVYDAPGHVGFYAGQTGELVEVLGGNQSNSVKISRYVQTNILSIRRIA